MKKNYILLITFFFTLQAFAQPVAISVDAAAGRRPISPYIFGKNNNLSDNPGSPLPAATWTMLRDAGLRFTRENGGNNGTKYNWRLKISSHPDWYNNVYAHNWDYAAATLQDSLPGVQGEWGFQLIGKAASNTANNFNDYAYNGSAWWSGVEQNLAGGGVVNSAGGSNAAADGDPNLYLEPWTADSTVNILGHWFGTGSLGYSSSQLKYWSMDNEPDIWNSTHDDVMPVQPTAEAFMQLYFAVAKKARARFPGIKLAGPVPASEWQWYAWNNAKITGADGHQYTWLEFFIKRIAEEEAASGVRLLDVIDIHSYPNETAAGDILNLHRIYFDSTYAYPGANGVKTTAASGWDNSITNENVFGRCSQWLNQYMGPAHGVTFAVSEYGFTNIDANITSVSYGSVLGTFADHGVDYFSPWYWYPGMWETMHLFSRYGKTTRIASLSSRDSIVSAYSSLNAASDSMTVIIVNRAQSGTETVNLSISNFSIPDGSYATRQLHALPAGETFVSETGNALSSGSVNVAGNALTVTVPALSTTAVLLAGTGVSTAVTENSTARAPEIYPNPAGSSDAVIGFSGPAWKDVQLSAYNMLGQTVYSAEYSGTAPATLTLPAAGWEKGVYIIRLSAAGGNKWTGRLVR